MLGFFVESLWNLLWVLPIIALQVCGTPFLLTCSKSLLSKITPEETQGTHNGNQSSFFGNRIICDTDEFAYHYKVFLFSYFRANSGIVEGSRESGLYFGTVMGWWSSP